MKHEDIKKHRIALGLTQSELARKAGIDRTILCKIENDKRPPSKDVIAACARVFQLNDQTRQPNRRNKAGLSDCRPWLREAFPNDRKVHVQPLRVAFTLARHSSLGSELVDWLDGQNFPSVVWTAIKVMAGQLNGPEQMLVLHGLRQGGRIQKAHPHEANFSHSVVQSPADIPLALFVDNIVIFPQVTVNVNCHKPRLDFLVALPGSPPAFIDVEIDGPSHQGSQERDRIRAARIGLLEIRLPCHVLERRDFWPYFWSLIRKQLEDRGRTWVQRLGRLS